MVDFLKNYGLIIGWVMGTFSSTIATYLTSLIDRYRFRVAMRSELSEFRLPLAGYVYAVAPLTQTFNQETLEWCKRQYQRAPATEERNRLVDGIIAQLRFSNDELAAYANFEVKKNKTKAIPKLNLWYMKSKPDLIALLTAEEQKTIVKILSHMERINGKIDDMIYWDRLTLQPNIGDNYKVAVENSRGSMIAIATACKRLGDLIDSLGGWNA